MTWIERKRSARSRFASAVRSRSPMNWSFARVRMTRTASSSCSSAATRRAMSRVSSFSWSPLGPTAPASWPPWPGSIMIVWSGSGPRAARRGRGRLGPLAMEVEHHARRVLQAKHLAGGRRALERHAEGGGAAHLAELGGRHQAVSDRAGGRPAARAHVRERDRQPALGLDEPGLDRRVRLEHHARVRRIRADAQVDAGRGRARGGAEARPKLGLGARDWPAARAPPRPSAARPAGPGAGDGAGRPRSGARHAAGWRPRAAPCALACRRAPAAPEPRASRRGSPAPACPRAWGAPVGGDRSGTRQVPCRTRTGAASETGRAVDGDAARVPRHLDHAVAADQASSGRPRAAARRRGRQAGDVGEEVVGPHRPAARRPGARAAPRRRC